MKPSRATRLVAALLAVISLLFTQYALASYQCPGMTMSEPTATAMAGNGMQDMANCTGMDMQQPALCHAHDHTGQQSLDKPNLPQVAPFVAAGPGLVVLALDDIDPPTASPPDRAFLARATAPPLAIRHCCLRI